MSSDDTAKLRALTEASLDESVASFLSEISGGSVQAAAAQWTLMEPDPVFAENRQHLDESSFCDSFNDLEGNNLPQLDPLHELGPIPDDLVDVGVIGTPTIPHLEEIPVSETLVPMITDFSPLDSKAVALSPAHDPTIFSYHNTDEIPMDKIPILDNWDAVVLKAGKGRNKDKQINDATTFWYTVRSAKGKDTSSLQLQDFLDAYFALRKLRHPYGKRQVSFYVSRDKALKNQNWVLDWNIMRKDDNNVVYVLVNDACVWQDIRKTKSTYDDKKGKKGSGDGGRGPPPHNSSLGGSGSRLKLGGEDGGFFRQGPYILSKGGGDERFFRNDTLSSNSGPGNKNNDTSGAESNRPVVEQPPPLIHGDIMEGNIMEVVVPAPAAGQQAVTDHTEPASTPNNNNKQQHSRRSSNKIRVCCPLTKQPFRDPVVHRGGLSFERDAILAQLVHVHQVCYPNRALVEYLDPSTDPHIELQADSTEKKGIFYCSITSNLLIDPVIDPEGNTFERHAIVAWIKRHGASPITGSPLSVDQLYDNTTLLTVLMQEVQQADDALNPVSRVRMAVPDSRAARADLLNAGFRCCAEDPNTPPQPQPLPLAIQLHASEQAGERRLQQEADQRLNLLCKLILLVALLMGLFAITYCTMWWEHLHP